MKIEIENLEGNFKKLHIEISPEIVDEHFTRQYREIQKSAELKGFRKGKAPLEIIKKFYGDGVSNHVAQSSREQSDAAFFDALAHRGLQRRFAAFLMSFGKAPFAVLACFQHQPAITGAGLSTQDEPGGDHLGGG